MDTDTKQTRCPHCSIAFYITNAQVLAAEGTVRCGICLSLFDANENVTSADSKSDIQPLPEETEENSSSGSALQASIEDAQDGIVPQGAETPVPDGKDPDQSAGEARPLHIRQLDELSAALPDQPQVFSGSESSGQAKLANRSRWPLLLLAIIGSAGLLVQALFYASAPLSMNQHYRPTLEVLCAQLGCSIAEQRNLALIHSDALVIQSRPDIADALQVDVVITNRAGFTQAFPGLQLQFEDLEGKVVAQRVFRPQQYLSGALTQLTSMKPQQGYRISLELVAPNSSAVSYSLRIVN